MTLTVRVITPIGTVWEGAAQSVILPSSTGEMGILSGHAPLLTSLDIGVLRILTHGKWMFLLIMGGFGQVEGDEVTILVNRAEMGDKINLQQAKAALEAAQDKLSHAQTRGEKFMATKRLKQARARLKAAQGIF